MKIIENVLDKKDFNELKNIVLCDEFPWFFNDHSTESKVSPPQFTHNFLKNYRISSYFFCLEKILQKIDHSVMFRIKANLNTKTSKIIETGKHSDADKRFTSAIFFLNQCNGYCKIGNKKVKSEDNKLLIFKSSEEHTGSTCTDLDRRMLINIVYIEKDNKLWLT